MSWLRKRNDFETGVVIGALYTSAAGLALLGFLSTCIYIYHIESQKEIRKYEERIEELERKIESCYEQKQPEILKLRQSPDH